MHCYIDLSNVRKLNTVKYRNLFDNLCNHAKCTLLRYITIIDIRYQSIALETGVAVV